MYDMMICPICGGNIEIDATHDRGQCNTCFATYVDGEIIPAEEEIEIGSDIH